MKLDDIAALAKVSKATASRALSDSPKVKKSTKELIQRIAKEHNYKPHTLASAFARKKSGIIGFCLLNKNNPSFGHPFFGPVLDGALEQAREDNYHIILAANKGADYVFEEPFMQDCIEGVVISSFAPAKAILEFKKRGIPQVLVNDVLDTKNNTFVMDDNYGGAYRLMQHLIQDRGHKSIGFLTDRLSHTSYLLRYFAYIDAHKEAGIPVYHNDKLPLSDLAGGYSPTSDYYLKKYGYDDIPLVGSPLVVVGMRPIVAYEAVKRLIATGNLPTALFAVSDSLAIGAIHALQDAGFRVPEDVAVAGYDDIISATAVTPALTTVRVDRKEIGRIAIRELETLIANPEKESNIIYVKNNLIIRKST
ncbi:MAG: LacI family DNA-binding transcriptional regulator [Sphaerochaetaceae bacterium]